MKPILFSENTTTFTNEGLGHLSDAISCHVKEVINGSFELEMTYPVEGVHFEDIREGRIIYSAHDETGNPQPFDIYRISRPINRKVTVYARHISYRLNDIVVKPFSVDGLQTALANLSTGAITVDNPFSFTSDKTSSGHFEVKVPTAIRPLMGGTEGSILDVYGGEWEYDHFNCVLRNHRGQDNGVNIRYGKNLTDIKKVTDVTNLWTGIVPYWQGVSAESTEETVVYYNGVIFSSLLHDTYPYDIIIAVDASSSFEEPPTAEQLLAWGRTYVQNNAKTGIPLSVKISFVQLWQTEEYKDIAPLQRLRIGDTVNIFYEALGVDNVARISGYDYDVLLDRYDSMTVGDVISSFATSVAKDIKEATKGLPTKTFFELAIGKSTELITGGLGGHVVINRNENGQPNEILIMNTADKDTATRVMRINYEGIAFGTGYNGPFNSAWTTLDGTFNAQNINVINLDAASIITGILRDKNNTNYWNLDTGEFRLAATTTVGGSTVQSIANSAASAAESNAKSYADDVAESEAAAAVAAQTQQSIFNKLTNNGQTQGIYLSGGKLYINADYIQSGGLSADRITSGTMSANRIYGGTLTLGGSGNANGIMVVKDSSGTEICRFDKNGATITGNVTLKNGGISAFSGYSYTYVWNILEWLTWSERNNFNIDAYSNGSLVGKVSWQYRSGQSDSFQTTRTTSKNIYAEITAVGVSNMTSQSSSTSYTTSFVELYQNDLYGILLHPNYYLAHEPEFILSKYGIRMNSPSGNMRIGMSSSGTPFVYSSSSMASANGTIWIGSGNNKVDIDNDGVRFKGNYASVILSSSYRADITLGANGIDLSTSSCSIVVGTSSQKINGKQITFDSSSSKRYKHDISDELNQENDPNRLYKLKVKQYIYNNNHVLQYEDMRGQILPGFIAEDVEEIYPSAVIHNSKGEIESWDERRIVPGMLALIQEQHKQIEELQERLSNLEERLARLEDSK